MKTICSFFVMASALMMATKAEANAAHCLAMSGDLVTNTCGYTVQTCWYDGSWHCWFFVAGRRDRLDGFAGSVDRYTCRGEYGVLARGGVPVGCK